jgi:acetolactate decarboxylase
MKLTFSLISIVIGFTGFSQSKIQVAGAMSNIMQKGNLSAYADLDTMQKDGLYALGPVENLKGEIIVLDGKVYVTSKSGDSLVNRDKSPKAAMLVYSYVSEWQKLEKKVAVSGLEELQKFIELTAKDAGVDVNQPFVFKLEVRAKELKYHIIDWEEGQEHTMDNHKQFAYVKMEQGQEFVLLGFYSNKHHSVFTHHSTNIHVHVLNKKTGEVGHLDAIDVEGNVTVNFSKR